MRTARQQEARSIRAEGPKQAQIIRAEADAEAAQDLCRKLRQGSRNSTISIARCRAIRRPSSATANDKPAPTTIILSPQNDYLKEFTGRSALSIVVQIALRRVDISVACVSNAKSMEYR